MAFHKIRILLVVVHRVFQFFFIRELKIGSLKFIRFGIKKKEAIGPFYSIRINEVKQIQLKLSRGSQSF